MEKSKDANQAWETFSQTGEIGAYLLYRAIKAKEEQ